MWDEITYPFLNLNGLGMDKWFHPTFYWAWDYLSMQGLKLKHVSIDYTEGGGGGLWISIYNYNPLNQIDI